MLRRKESGRNAQLSYQCNFSGREITGHAVFILNLNSVKIDDSFGPCRIFLEAAYRDYARFA